MLLIKIKEWLDRKGKIWFFRATVLTSIVVTTLSAFGFYPLSTNTVLVFILGLLLIFAEIFFTEVLDIRKRNTDGYLLDWPSATPLLREDVRQGRKLTVVARSGETFYYTLRDILLERGDKLSIDLVLTKTVEDTEDFSNYQTGGAKRWQSLSEEASGNVTISFIDVVLEVQALIVDEKSAYLAYRAHSVGTKAITLDHLRISAESNQGRFLIGLYKTWVARHIKQGKANNTNLLE